MVSFFPLIISLYSVPVDVSDHDSPSCLIIDVFVHSVFLVRVSFHCPQLVNIYFPFLHFSHEFFSVLVIVRFLNFPSHVTCSENFDCLLNEKFFGLLTISSDFFSPFHSASLL